MNKKWHVMRGISLLICTFLVGCGSASNGEAPIQPEGESSQVERVEQEEAEEEADENHITNNEDNTEAKVEGGKRHLNDLDPPEGVDYRIADEYFVRDTDEIYNHLEDYVGKTLQYEGMVTHVDGERTAIIRLYDLPHEEHAHEISVGLDAVYAKEWPAEKTWVRVTGVIEEGVAEDGSEVYPVLQVLTLEEIEKGQEKVYN